MDELVFSEGELCGPYRILKLLGCGGFAEVYLGVNDAANMNVAIKCLRYCHVKNARNIKRLAAETEILCELDHPNIVQVEDAGLEKGVLWLAMEYLPGQTLRQLIRRARGPLPPSLALYYATRIADGVGAAHALNVVHRDLKPENVMVTTQDEVKVLDLGSAKFFDRNLTLSTGSTVVGTPLYMSPEQIQGEVVDGRTDVYALGLILYEMLAGRHALTVLSGKLPPAFEIGTLQMHARPKPLHEVVKGLPEFLWPIVSRAIEKDPGKRFGTMAEFAAAMREVSKELSDDPSALKLWDLGSDADEIEDEDEAGKCWVKTPAGEIQSMWPADVERLMVKAHAANDASGKEEAGKAPAVDEEAVATRRQGAPPPWMCEEQLEGVQLVEGTHYSGVRSVSVLKPLPAPKVQAAPVIHLWSRRERKLAKEQALESKAVSDISPLAASVEMVPIAGENLGDVKLPESEITVRMNPLDVRALAELAPTVQIESGDALKLSQAVEKAAAEEQAASAPENEPQPKAVKRVSKKAQHLSVVAGTLFTAAVVWIGFSLRASEPFVRETVSLGPQENAPAPMVMEISPKEQEPAGKQVQAESLSGDENPGADLHVPSASRNNKPATVRARLIAPSSGQRAGNPVRIAGHAEIQKPAASDIREQCRQKLLFPAELGRCAKQAEEQEAK